MVTERIAKKWHAYYMSGPYRLVDVAAHVRQDVEHVRRVFAAYNLPRKPKGANQGGPAIAALRDEARRRYEAGEPPEQIAAALGVHRVTIQSWRANHRWSYQRRLTADEKATILRRILAGDHQPTIAADLGVHAYTVNAYARRLRSGELSPPAPTLAGWFCSSCTWRGGSAEAWKQHKMQMHEARL
jgi:DNA-binding CsgD family transcriptional regulator